MHIEEYVVSNVVNPRICIGIRYTCRTVPQQFRVIAMFVVVYLWYYVQNVWACFMITSLSDFTFVTSVVQLFAVSLSGIRIHPLLNISIDNTNKGTSIKPYSLMYNPLTCLDLLYMILIYAFYVHSLRMIWRKSKHAGLLVDYKWKYTL